MKLVPYWRNAWKLVSVQLIALITVLGGLREASEYLQQLLPPELYLKVNAGLAICALLARLIHQPKVTK
ncbi:DUF7940 domain-containing protein [Pseudomonas solani]|uniref:DUF7940 domain-containing protein n=1 Tax=Pseudomonas solani TaxID=2731552 RepID=UPI003D6B2DFF